MGLLYEYFSKRIKSELAQINEERKAEEETLLYLEEKDFKSLVENFVGYIVNDEDFQNMVYNSIMEKAQVMGSEDDNMENSIGRMIYDIQQLGELKFNRINEPDFFKEVCIDTKLPEEMEAEFELTDYDISVRFHDDGEIAVFVYDNIEEETTNIEFASNVRDEIIKFARKYLN